ncbi:MAG: class I SAM-dependent methyltransferase [Promethearchaeota archaeon]
MIKIKKEKPKYGWYVRDLIIGFMIVGLIGLTAFIFGLLIQGIFGIILFIAGLTLTLTFLWPGLGMTVLNLTIGDEFPLDKRMEALYKISSPQILDVGCGTGRHAIKIAKILEKGGHLTGIDIYERIAIAGNSLDTVQRNARIEGVDEKTTFQYGSATEIPFDDETFDIVNVSSVLHEIHDPNGQEKALKEIYRVLKLGGYVYISEWNRSSLQTIAFFGIFCFVFKPYKYWQRLIKKHGFQEINYKKLGGLGIFSARKI